MQKHQHKTAAIPSANRNSSFSTWRDLQVTRNITELFLQQGNTQPYFMTVKVQTEYSSVSRESSSLLCSFCHTALKGKVELNSGLGVRQISRNSAIVTVLARRFCDTRGGGQSHKTLPRITHDSMALCCLFSQKGKGGRTERADHVKSRKGGWKGS